MKKTNVLVLCVIAISALFLCSYKEGPAYYSGWDCTGAESGLNNPTGCNAGSCHGSAATTGITIALEVDSAGNVPVTKYKGGLTYTVKITGTNTTANTLPKFGFQIAAITGSAEQVTPANAGTWQQSGLPAGVQFSAAKTTDYVTNIIEHSTPLSPSSGSGGTGTIYTESINWTAPTAGTGTVSFWCALNAVNNDGVASSADKWNTQNLVLSEDTVSVTNSINSTADNINLNIFPNPTIDYMQVELNNANPGIYFINAYDAEGRKVSTNRIEVAGNFAVATINTSNWATGTYFLQITNGNIQKVMKVLKR